jgi:hypothetical protein
LLVPHWLPSSRVAEFADKKVSTADFAKKLMGQIVFRYFLQKKGWLGVPKGGDWGDGPHNFFRQLFDGTFGGYKNFLTTSLNRCWSVLKTCSFI